MSLDATRWAWSIQSLRPSEKLILLSMADRAGEAFTVHPSIQRLEKDTGLNRKTIISAIDRMESAGLIADTGDRIGRTKQVKIYKLIGVVGREEESKSPKSGTIKESLNGDSLDSERVPLFPYKSPKNGTAKESQKRYSESTSFESTKESKTHGASLDSFEKFWKVIRPKWFGHVGNKQPALKAWIKLNPDDLLAERITRAAIRDAEYRRRTHANHEFIPAMKNASGWINNRCWEDVQDNPSAKSEIQAMVDSFKGCI